MAKRRTANTIPKSGAAKIIKRGISIGANKGIDQGFIRRTKANGKTVGSQIANTVSRIKRITTAIARNSKISQRLRIATKVNQITARNGKFAC